MNPLAEVRNATASSIVLILFVAFGAIAALIAAYRWLRERHREGETLKYWRRGPLE